MHLRLALTTVALATLAGCSLINTGSEYLEGDGAVAAGGEGGAGVGGSGATGGMVTGGAGGTGGAEGAVARVFVAAGRQDKPTTIPGSYDTLTRDVVYADIMPDGTLTDWRYTAPLLSPGSIAIRVIGENMVAFGRTSEIGSYNNPVLQFAPIVEDGVGAWDVLQDETAVNLSSATAVLSENAGYLIGGSTSDGMGGTLYLETTTTHFINASVPSLGTLTAGPSMATQRRTVGAIEAGGFVYVVGGYGSSPTYKPQVESAAVQADGTLGMFMQLPDLPGTLGMTGLDDAALCHNSSHLFIVGGRISGNFSDQIVTAALNGDGTLGAYQEVTPLPGGLYRTACVAWGSKLYVFGGEEPTSRTADVLSIDVMADGTLGQEWEVLDNPPLPYGRAEHAVTVVGFE